MNFNAQDIALLITTSATAATALFAFVIPIWTRKAEIERERNEKVRAEVRNAIDLVLRETQIRGENLKKQLLNLAKMKRAKEIGQVIEAQDFEDELDLAILRLDVLGLSYGFDTKQIGRISHGKSAVFATYWASSFEEDAELKRETLSQCLAQDEKLREQLLVSINKLWNDVTEKFPDC